MLRYTCSMLHQLHGAQTIINRAKKMVVEVRSSRKFVTAHYRIPSDLAVQLHCSIKSANCFRNNLPELLTEQQSSDRVHAHCSSSLSLERDNQVLSFVLFADIWFKIFTKSCFEFRIVFHRQMVSTGSCDVSSLPAVACGKASQYR